MPKQHFLYLIILFSYHVQKKKILYPRTAQALMGVIVFVAVWIVLHSIIIAMQPMMMAAAKVHVDNGDFYLSFNGSNSNVDLGDMIDQGSYTKAAWVKRYYGYAVNNNIISGNTGHALFAPNHRALNYRQVIMVIILLSKTQTQFQRVCGPL